MQSLGCQAVTSSACLREAIKEVREAIEQIKQSVQEILENAIILDCKLCRLGVGEGGKKLCYAFCNFLEEFLQSYCSERDCNFTRIKVAPHVASGIKDGVKYMIRGFNYLKTVVIRFDDNSWIILSPPREPDDRGTCVYGVDDELIDRCYRARTDAKYKAEAFATALLSYLFKNFRCEYRDGNNWAIHFDDGSKLELSKNGGTSPIVTSPSIDTVYKADVVNIVFRNIHFLKHLCKAYSR